MKQNELYALIIGVVRDGLTTRSIEAEVAQAYNDTQQGVPTTPAVFISALPARRYGWLKRNDKWDAVESQMTHEENQWLTNTFQISTSVLPDPNDLTEMTAWDLAEAVASILQGDTGRNALQEAGVGILRITDIRNPQFVDDRGRFEYAPNFDFTVTHEDVTLSTNPVVETFEVNIKGV